MFEFYETLVAVLMLGELVNIRINQRFVQLFHLP